MAAINEDLGDIEELCITDELTEKFTKAANHLQTLLPTIDNQKLLLLYGYYKQGLEGPCNISKPSWFDMKGKAKWEAWKKLGNMPQNEAKYLYVKNIEALDPNFSDSENKDEYKEGWVSVSTLQKPDEEVKESEKNIIDFIRDGCTDKVCEILKFHDVNKLDEEGLGLIHWAVDCGSLEILKLLVSHGADVNLCDKDGQTALHYASSCGYTDCLIFLLENGCKSDVLDNSGLDAVSVACDGNIEQLLKAAR